ncbi:MAG: HNH endonuclease [Actinobacteria bacterium]|nr:HNH endonuclease [Actinomycetota bacterium]MBE3114598.1 HNH endonuclease [Actinomycetota bacterium]
MSPYSGPDERYGQKWNARRFLIFAKYNYICQICKRYSKGNMCLHHIRPIGISNDNSSRNLLPICNSCHYMIHQEYIENKKRFSV